MGDSNASAAFDPNRKTDFKVYVSRIPKHWTSKLMHEHFVSLQFGAVAGVEMFVSKRVRKEFEKRGVGKICYAFKNEGKCDKGDACLFSHALTTTGENGGDSDNEDGEGGGQNLGSAVVYFYDQESVDNALNQSSLHLSRRIIKISPFESIDDGRDVSICYAWKNFQCTHGDSCKFSHEGPGSLQKIGTPYQGRKFQCLSFKTKGKCSKGDSCKFLHTADVEKIKKRKERGDSSNEAATGAVENAFKKSSNNSGEGGGDNDSDNEEADSSPKSGDVHKEKAKGICHKWQKKGKCKNGDKCIFLHTILDQSSESNKKQVITSDGETKRRRIDGSVLVEQRKINKTYFKDD